jgi:Heme/copper-type cytochrome/quinol oxidases, subunit 1
MDAYAFAFGLMGISIILAGFNMIVTIICYRAPGMRWSRLPMFVWAMLTTGFLLVSPPRARRRHVHDHHRPDGADRVLRQPARRVELPVPGPVLVLRPSRGLHPGPARIRHRVRDHPGLHQEAAVRLQGRRGGMFGVAILSFFVWQHHLFDSGMDPDMRPLFMLTTELISIPTGFIFLVAMGTFWKAKIRLTVPMLFAIALFVNFLFGGISGVFVSDVPVDTTAHGSFFVLAHFHYTIMGGLIFAFFGGIYYWLPKVMGITMNERLGKIHFWTMFIAFNSTFMPLFAVGLLGQPRRVWEYAQNLQTLNDWASISAFCLGGSMLIFIFNFAMSTVVWRHRAPQNPWNARGLEWQVPSPPPADNFEYVPVVLAGPYEYGDPDALPVADLHPPAGVIGGALATAGIGSEE